MGLQRCRIYDKISYMTSSVRFCEAHRCHSLLLFYKPAFGRLLDIPSILLRGAGMASQNLRLWKSWVIGMWHGSVYVIGYGEEHVVLAIGMGGMSGHKFSR